MELTKKEIMDNLERGQCMFECDGYEMIEALGGTTVDFEIVRHDSWIVNYKEVIKLPDGRYVVVEYGVGATESQENEEECYAFFVEPYEAVVTKYRKVLNRE